MTVLFLTDNSTGVSIWVGEIRVGVSDSVGTTDGTIPGTDPGITVGTDGAAGTIPGIRVDIIRIGITTILIRLSGAADITPPLITDPHLYDRITTCVRESAPVRAMLRDRETIRDRVMAPAPVPT